MGDKIVKIFEDSVSLYKGTADKIVDIYTEAVKNIGDFTIALSGGGTPKKLYELLATSHYTDKIDWNKVKVFFGDERYVPRDHPDNNSKMAREALLNHVSIPESNIFVFDTSLPPQKSASEYAKSVKSELGENYPHFDLILLGLGGDGHTASLFPWTPILKESKKMVKQVFVRKMGTYRLSFTYPLINAANNVIFLVSGSSKSDIISEILDDSANDNRYPAQGVQPLGQLYWHLDRYAASGLPTG